ncbi:hypothetical protein KEM48_013519 [Puccinia striiformis f. sp. tritici PST-130]|uniref:Hydrophobin n=1 Tax=Puccinia striiformis f. sp. tritici PST-78 TaxID=1165861 RepID=A0A0L0USZ5_9BASI|nr:hypothetical protein KEM48_013519 [Puccinia striiformis f. sp. tritici PST-130]KNE90026.1 hypothetical protein PSTG_16503 [Puccinia striiformis f. sp. tritici PST-78]
MYSPPFLGGLMLAFSLVSISIAASQFELTCASEKVGNEPAQEWACVNSVGVYRKMKGFGDMCSKTGEHLACCIEGKDLCASNCKTLPTYSPPPLNKVNCSDKKVNGVDAPNLMCKNDKGIHMLKFGCEKGAKFVCCISLPEGETYKDKDCLPTTEK